MARYIENTAILAKPEAPYKTDAIPTGGANAILVSDVTITPLNATNVSRNVIRGFFGGSEQLVGTAFKDVSFSVEYAGSGVAGTAPAFGPLLRACAFAEVITAGLRVEYNPISSLFESVSIYVYDDGVLHKLLGARGTVSLGGEMGDRPLLKFKFMGIDGGDSVATLGALSYANFVTPKVVTDANSGDVTIGCTYASGALSGGTAYTSTGLSVDIGNTTAHTPLLGSEEIDLSQRKVTGSTKLDLTAAAEVAFMASVKANTLQSLGFVHGTVPGNICTLFMPAMQMTNPSKQEINGRRLIGYDLNAVPSGAGNNDIRFCFA